MAGVAARFASTGIYAKPFVCADLKERPVGLPRYVGAGSCGAKEAREAMRYVREQFAATCAPSTENSGRVTQRRTILANPTAQVTLDAPSFKGASLKCADYVTEQNENASHALILESFGLLATEHPFFDIVFRLDADQLHDFRSSVTFQRLGEALANKLEGRELNVLYPAGGSHLAPVVTALELIDRDKIDGAHYTYAEIDSRALVRVERYLRSIYVFEGLKKGTKHFDMPKNSSETTFSWTYKGKPMTLTFALNRADGKEAPFNYVRPEQLKAANLVVLHDLGDPFAAPTFAPAFGLIHGPQNRQRWILEQSGRSFKPGVTVTEELNAKGGWTNGIFVEGAYGCGHTVDLTDRRAGLKLRYIDDRGRVVSPLQRSSDDPWSKREQVHVDAQGRSAMLRTLEQVTEFEQRLKTQR